MKAVTRVLPVAVYGLVVAAVALLVVHKAVSPTPIYRTWFEPTVNATVFGALATLVLRRGANPRMGAVFAAIALVAAIQALAGEYATFARAVHRLPAAGATALTSQLTTVLIIPLITVLLLVYPDGRLLSRRWRPLFWLTAGCAAVELLAGMVRPGGYEDVAGYSNPLASVALWPLVHQIDRAAQPLELGVLIVAIVGVGLRYRRANDLVRQQLKWFGLAVGAFLVVAVGIIAASRHLPPWAEHVGFGLAVVGFAVAIGFAILRHRLYDIDRVISRTVSYAVVTGLLVGVYVACVTVITRVLPSTSSVGVAASTLAVAALFQPLRRRVQTRVDRRFNRARYDAERTVDSFSRRLRGEVDLETVRRDLLGVVNTAMEPAVAEIWLRESRQVAR